jgi:diguanylate cyclase (GGDEF)-like protein
VTGLLSRAAWEPRAAALLAGRGNVLGFIDLDEFKPINDRWGHAAGDEVLSVTAARLEEHLGDTGLVGRAGGDELAFVATFGGFPAPERELDRLVERLSAPIPLFNGVMVRVGVSLGLAWRGDLPSGEVVVLSEALAAADTAMYDAKVRGAGWCVYDPDVHVVRPVESIVPGPRRRPREHGPAAAARCEVLA